MRGERDRVHSEPLYSYTDDGIEDAHARGVSWIKRNCREWPPGYSLYYRIRTEGKKDYLDFYFVPAHDDDDLPLF